jgi:hypothetical protein
LAWVLMALFVLSGSAQAVPVSVRVLESHYTTSVWASTVPTETSRTTTSPAPVADAVVVDASIVARTSADLFAVEAWASHSPFRALTPVRRTRASATAAVTFAPIVDGIASLDFALVGTGLFWAYSTASLHLWDEGWANRTLPAWWGAAYPKIPSYGHFTIEQPFDAEHEYALTISTTSTGVDDTQGVTIHLTGLQAVSEPSCILLVAASLVGACIRGRRPTRPTV